MENASRKGAEQPAKHAKKGPSTTRPAPPKRNHGGCHWPRFPVRLVVGCGKPGEQAQTNARLHAEAAQAKKAPTQTAKSPAAMPAIV